ncbi:MAG: tRNA pseudouridine(54/55) synthase Pus10 [Candidatus Lokiarchaeota archaeon]|nr:tRNA pseudouridine(54/55) synthase Pus10 [Candidatus Lokiarchaeota archaeon]
MTINEKVLEIYHDYYICPHCLGRMFSLFATNTTNLERGNSILLALMMQLHENYLSSNEKNDDTVNHLRILAEKAKYVPAMKVMEKEGLIFDNETTQPSCYLCDNIFSSLAKYTLKAMKKLEDLDYESFLVGTDLNGKIINLEDEFKVRFKILGAESFKSHFNREVGKFLSTQINKSTDFANPDITIIFSLSFDSFSIDLVIRSLFIYGRYNKLIRGIPQTHWNCRRCKGMGCDNCNFTGKQHQTSVEELIIPEFIKISKSTGAKFHGAGREDIDVRMLGKGRPFILELQNPVIRLLNLENLEKRVNKITRKKVEIHDLQFSNKNKVISIKNNAENTKKLYKALVQSEKRITKSQFNEFLILLQTQLVGKKLSQRTPERVSHRRADKVRQKYIYELNGRYLKSDLFEFTIKTQGGTYIKELINGDEGRTINSFTELFGAPLICKELDVLQIDI